MWGGPSKLYTVGGIIVGVKNMDRAVAWYCDKLGLSFESQEPNSREVYIGYTSVDGWPMIPIITLVPVPEGQSNVYADRHQILFSRKLDALHAEFSSKGIRVWPIQTDSGGNRFFNFQDLEGNTIEVCIEP